MYLVITNFMDDLIQISKLNDFIFCPKSLYFHSIYDNFNTQTFQSKFQTNGKIKHQNIDKNIYSTSSNFLQGIEVYSNKYGLTGKIDLFDQKKHELIERKARVKQIFDGYKYQLYAQYFCLIEMGYEVKRLFIHSLEDNKRYPIPLPNQTETEKFEKLILEIRNYDIQKNLHWFAPESKCANCIYKNLCH